MAQTSCDQHSAFASHSAIDSRGMVARVLARRWCVSDLPRRQLVHGDESEDRNAELDEPVAQTDEQRAADEAQRRGEEDRRKRARVQQEEQDHQRRAGEVQLTIGWSEREKRESRACDCELIQSTSTQRLCRLPFLRDV